MKNVFAVLLMLICFLAVDCLCTRLNREQELLKASKLNTQVAEQRAKTAKVEFINELYRFERYKALFNDAVHKDDWIKELEQFKRDNGFYEGEVENGDRH